MQVLFLKKLCSRCFGDCWGPSSRTEAQKAEVVAGVLEALPTRGRLVGIVTHVAALAERFPERLVVEKRPAGSRVYWA